jgi:exopolysaccharide production protein ExoZ
MTLAKHLPSIQCLRAIAAIMVVYHHARDRLPRFSEAFPSPIGQAGVDLFFVISGFIMVATTWSRPVRPSAFLLRRVTRIVPVYWFYTTILAVFVLAFPTAFELKITFPHYVLSLLFIPHANPVDQSISPLLQPGWTLEYEMFFYVVFAITLLSLSACRVLVATLALIGLVVTGLVFKPTGLVLLSYTSPLMLEFGLGIVIGYLHCINALDGLSSAIGWCIMVGAAFAVAATAFILPSRPLFDFGDAPIRVSTYGLAATFVVIGALVVGSKRRSARTSRALVPLMLVGDASYSLYLTHLFSLDMLRSGWIKLGFGTEGKDWTFLFVATALFASIGIGVWAYFLLERPMMRATQRTLRADRSVLP